MLLAVPTFEGRVSPRFCFAQDALIVRLEEDRIESAEQLRLPQPDIPTRLAELARLGVTVVLCGGFNRSFLPHARKLGIQVVWGLHGPVREVVRAYLNDALDPYAFTQSPCRRRGRGKGRGRRGRA